MRWGESCLEEGSGVSFLCVFLLPRVQFLQGCLALESGFEVSGACPERRRRGAGRAAGRLGEEQAGQEGKGPVHRGGCVCVCVFVIDSQSKGI